MQSKPSVLQRLRRQFRRLAKSQAGVTTLEYIVIAVLIVAVAVGVTMAITKVLRDRGEQIVNITGGKIDVAGTKATESGQRIDTYVSDADTQAETVQGEGSKRKSE